MNGYKQSWDFNPPKPGEADYADYIRLRPEWKRRNAAEVAAIVPPVNLDLAATPDVRDDPLNEPDTRPFDEQVAAYSGEPVDVDDGHVRSRKPSAADMIVGLAMERYDLGRAADGEPFAIERGGPNVARMFRGGRASLRANLAALYAQAMERVPPAQALVDALAVLEGRALAMDRTPLPLRATTHGDSVIVDIGDEDGRAIEVTSDGWTVLGRSPVTFRRSELTAALPEPAPGSLDELYQLLNVAPDDRPLLLAHQVAALLGVPVPIIYLRGPAGAAKTTGARTMARIIDPSPAPVRSVPRDPESWAVTAGGSYVVVIDNITHVPDWLSDAWCRAVTGEGFLRRALYTDQAISVVAFRRALYLTAIDAGAMRGDLADRLCAIDLAAIGEEARKDDAEMEVAFRKAHPSILGAVLTLTSAVLRVLPTLRLERRPRMADYGRVLAAVDVILGTDGLVRYMDQRGELQREAAEGDRIGAAVIAFMETRAEWIGTATDLLAEVTPERPPKDWPATPRALSGALRRVAQPLAAAGVKVIFPKPTGHDKQRRIQMTNTNLEGRGIRPSAPSAEADLSVNSADGADANADGADANAALPEPYRPHFWPLPEHDADGADGADGRNPSLLGPVLAETAPTCSTCGKTMIIVGGSPPVCTNGPGHAKVNGAPIPIEEDHPRSAWATGPLA